MKIAVASDKNKVSEHFGHCEGFVLYDIENDRVKKKMFVANPGHKPGYLPVFLKEQKVDVIIAGGMGESAQNLFDEKGIDIVVGVQGNTDDTISQYISGELQSSGSVCIEHAHEGHCNN